MAARDRSRSPRRADAVPDSAPEDDTDDLADALGEELERPDPVSATYNGQDLDSNSDTNCYILRFRLASSL